MAGDMSISCLFFYFFAIRYKMADWWPFCYLNVSPQPFLRFASSELVQTWHKQSTWWHTHATHFILQSDQRWPTGRMVTILVVRKKTKQRYRTRSQPFLGHAFTDVVQTWHPDNELFYAHHFFFICLQMHIFFFEIRSDQRWLIGGHFVT